VQEQAAAQSAQVAQAAEASAEAAQEHVAGLTDAQPQPAEQQEQVQQPPEEQEQPPPQGRKRKRNEEEQAVVRTAGPGLLPMMSPARPTDIDASPMFELSNVVWTKHPALRTQTKKKKTRRGKKKKTWHGKKRQQP
jgi:hypothetical protein